MQRVMQDGRVAASEAVCPSRSRTAGRGGGTEVVVIGAGLGGLSAAIHLRLAGHEVTSGSAGGRI
jgi:NADPH-dependent 2,4-dienoyl-CoA reductase/sulfur reductase-like enzyme